MQSIVKREQALLRIRQFQALTDVQKVEPRALERIIDDALDTPPEENHWIAYERIKKFASSVVGWNAPHQEISTRIHYETMLDFIDWLLPEFEERNVLEVDEFPEEEEEPAFVPRRIPRFYPREVVDGTLEEIKQIGEE